MSNDNPSSRGDIIKPLVKIKRVRGGLYRVYKLVNGNYKIKRTFFTMHQANRYVKGFKK